MPDETAAKPALEKDGEAIADPKVADPTAPVVPPVVPETEPVPEQHVLKPRSGPQNTGQ